MTLSLYHYTDAKGYAGIMNDMVILSSTSASRPADVRHGDGVYLTDIVPGSLAPSRIARRLTGRPFPLSKVGFYVEILLNGLDVVAGRDHVFVVPGTLGLDIHDRLLSHGRTSLD